MASKVRVGIVGSQFAAEMHFEGLRQVPDAEVVAVASPTAGHAQAFAEARGIPRWFTDHREMLDSGGIDMVTVACPNDLHCRVTLDAAATGIHVVCEKPLAMNLDECDRMIAACEAAGVHLMYAECVMFTPKYVRAKELVDEGAFGKVYSVRDLEFHGGAPTQWFWDVDRSGGGALMDMGCHSIQAIRWLYDNAPILDVYAQLGNHVHGERTRGDDLSLCIMRFEGDRVGVAESSWGRLGGIDHRAEIHGTDGHTMLDLDKGISALTYSREGYGYAGEKVESTAGWSFTMYEESWNFGIPQEMAHFVRCAQGLEEPRVTGEDGRAVLEVICAGYHSAATGRRVALPFTKARSAKKPIDLWLAGDTGGTSH